MKNKIYLHPSEDRELENAIRDIREHLKFFTVVLLLILVPLGFLALFLIDETEMLWK